MLKTLLLTGTLLYGIGYLHTAPLPQVNESQIEATTGRSVNTKTYAATAHNDDEDFSSEPIPNDVFKRMKGKSYKAGCTVSRAELRYLRIKHFTTDGTVRTGEIVCHKNISQDLLDIFRSLYKARYPIEHVALVDDYDANDQLSMRHNNTSCFNYRRVAGSKKLSAHSRGTAIDINPRYNPHVKRRADGTLKVEPPEGKPYVDRSKTFTYKIDHNDLCYKLFTAHGFKWGGNWRNSKDYQHFEK